MEVVRQPCCSFLGQRRTKLASGLKGESHALDIVRDLACTVGAGIGHILHTGWVRPHPVGLGRRRSCNQSRARSKGCVMEVKQT